MERMNAVFARLVWQLGQWQSQLARSWGLWEASLLALLLLALALIGGLVHQQQQLERRQSQLAAVKTYQPIPPPETQLPDNDVQRLQAFQQLLLPYQDIPQSLQDLFRLAEDLGLRLKRAEYQTLAEPRGGFLRYRINLPVQGSADTVHRYLYEALKTHRNLALENVQLKRESLNSPLLEANIQWVFLARLPPAAARQETP